MKRIELVGQRFGRLVVKAFIGSEMWACECDCGNSHISQGRHMRSGEARSCGCITKDGSRKKKHGLTGSITWKTWASMKQRCLNQNCHAYPNYGGRGISIAEKWLEFEGFVEDMGTRPVGDYSLDRINPNGNYEPGNCRWATRYEQTHNRRPSSQWTTGRDLLFQARAMGFLADAGGDALKTSFLCRVNAYLAKRKRRRVG